MYPDASEGRRGLCAISSDPDGLAAGVTRQTEDCRAFAERRAWPVADVYVDNDASAYSGRRRPEYDRMLDDLAAGIRDAVIVYHLDRLHRRPRELEDFIDLCDRSGIRDLACVTGEIDFGTYDGRFHARILGAVSRKESDDNSRRLIPHAPRARPRRQGERRWHPPLRLRQGPCDGDPRGSSRSSRRWRSGFLPETACARSPPVSTSAPSRRSRGRDWTTYSVRQLLYSARMSGQRERHGEIVGKAVWPAIIKPAHTTRIRALLNDPERRTNRVARKYLLAGLLRCGKLPHHDGVATAQRRGRGRYVCTRDPGRDGCGGTFILADEADAFITAAVIHRLDTPRLIASIRRRDSDDPAVATLIRGTRPRPGAARRAGNLIRGKGNQPS